MGVHDVWRYEESALVLIDYQPKMVNQIRSEDPFKTVSADETSGLNLAQYTF